MYGRDGIPLMIPIDAGIEELRAEAAEPGRYRLDPVDEEHRPIADATPAYVVLQPEPPAPRPEATTAPRDRLDTLESLLTEITRANIETTRANLALGHTVVERFAGMMESAAVLVRAAGGVPVSAPPLVLADAAEPSGADEVDEIDEVAPAGLDLNALVAQVVTSVVTAVCSGQVKLPALGTLLDWRRAAPAPQTAAAPGSTAPVAQTEGTAAAAVPTAPGADSSAVPPEPSRNSTAAASDAAAGGAAVEASPPQATAAAEALASLSPVTMGRLMAVQQALTPDERVLALAVLRELAPAELQAWAQELTQLPLKAAVTKIRAVLHGAPSAAVGGAS